jgi:23S rRNA (cytosine1962-C5)-methyltransferase
MSKSRSRRAPEITADHRRDSQRTPRELLEPRGLTPPADLPSVRLRSVRVHPFLFRKMIDRADDRARPGDLVAVHTPQGELLGHGLYNPRAEIAVRMLQFERTVPGREFWIARLQAAADMRRNLLGLDSVTDAYRVVHAEADGLSGFIVDRYGDTLSAEVFSLAMFQRSQALLTELAGLLGTAHTLVQIPAQTHGQEGFVADPLRSGNLPRETVITEYGTKFRVRFEEGHKTGFFCDQRDNRQHLASFCRGKTVLDLCCYTGGFAMTAAARGAAAEVTGVDLDETAIELARENARLNNVRPRFVHADVFAYMRDMLQTGRRYDVVVLDPPKLIRNRRELEDGTRKHLDLNRLAMQLVTPGGLLLTCTCSGLLTEPDFLHLLHTAARQAGKPREQNPGAMPHIGRTLQVLAKTGAAPDHPVSLDCPETEYLKAAWLRVT